MVTKRLLLAVVGAALLVALPGSASARPAQTQTLANTFVMAAYIGPVQKPFPTVDISGGVDIFQARDALLSKLGAALPFGAPTPFTITPSQMGQARNAFAALTSSPAGTKFKIGLYLMNMSTGKVTAKRFGATPGKAALAKLAGSLPAAPRGAIKRLRTMAFP